MVNSNRAPYWLPLTAAVVIEYLLLWFLFSSVYVKADSFYPSGDIFQCDFAHVMGIGIGQLPSAGIIYDASEVSGVTKDWLVTHKITDLANILKGSAHRYANVASAVSVPPETKISLAWYPYNFSGHDITIPSARMFISNPAKESPNDLSMLVAFEDVHSTTATFMYGATQITRAGHALVTTDIGTVKPIISGNAPTGRVLFEGTVIQPIGLSEPHLECGLSKDGTVKVSGRFDVHNVGAYKETVELDGQTDQEVEAGGTVSMQFTREYPYSEKIQVDDVQVSNINGRRECATYGDTAGDTSNPNTRLMVISRNDQGSGSWVSGQPDLATVSHEVFFCVTRIPYTLMVPTASCTIPKQATISFVGDFTEIPSDTSVSGQVLIHNDSGPITDAIATVSYPKTWDSYIQLPGAKRVVDNTIYIDLPIAALAYQESISFPLVITAPHIIPQDVPLSIQLAGSIFSSNAKTDASLQKKQTVETEIQELKCLPQGANTGALVVTITGNTDVGMITVPVRVTGETALQCDSQSVPIMLYFVFSEVSSGKITVQQHETDAAEYLITISGTFGPGIYTFPFTVTTNTPISWLTLTNEKNSQRLRALCTNPTRDCSVPSVVTSTPSAPPVPTIVPTGLPDNLAVQEVPPIPTVAEKGPFIASRATKGQQSVLGIKRIRLPNTDIAVSLVAVVLYATCAILCWIALITVKRVWKSYSKVRPKNWY